MRSADLPVTPDATRFAVTRRTAPPGAPLALGQPMRSFLVVLCAFGLAHTARAEDQVSGVTELVKPADPTSASYRDDPPVATSYLVPAVEIVVLNIAANLASRAAGQPWADVTLSTMKTNLTSAWVYDDDVFVVNQFGHPYGGAMLFLAARSSGLGFWTSAAYGFGGSLIWETLMENEPSSINDQLTTSIGGAFLGEALHRWSRAVLSRGGEQPSISRRVLSTLIDPVGTANRMAFHDHWHRTPPPRMYSSLAVGWNRELDVPDQSPLHLELAVSHGLPSDPRFVPRVPFDHFDLRVQLDVSTDRIAGYVDLRGLILGRAFGQPRMRALAGMYGTYDYSNPDHARAGAIGVGPGIAMHAGLGERGFAEAVAVATLVPFGAAGGAGDGEGPQRDYHHGPGLGQFVELELGVRGLGLFRINARAIEIDGTLIGDATEAVVVTTAGLMVAIAPHHAIGADVVYSARSANFNDATMTAFEQAAQIRLTYAITSDSAFGGGE